MTLKFNGLKQEFVIFHDPVSQEFGMAQLVCSASHDVSLGLLMYLHLAGSWAGVGMSKEALSSARASLTVVTSHSLV